MKAFIVVVGISFLLGGPAFSKMQYTKEVGLKCDQCHDKGKPKKEPSRNELYKKAAEHSKGIKTQSGDFKGMKNCKECHGGKRKP